MTKKKNNFKKIVIKIGTQNLVFNGRLNQLIFYDVARQIVDILKMGIQVTVITSGAVQAGRERLKFLSKEVNWEKKSIAGIGTRHLFNKWGLAFEKYGYEIGEMLITYANWQDEQELKSIKKTILDYVQFAVVPILNENDVVSDREIKSWENKISENDQLASMVAKLIGADAILFLTDVGGIFDKNPQDLSARMYSVININHLPPELKISNNTSAGGTGGMEPKVKWASGCVRDGIYTVIGGLQEKDAILKFVRREYIGTLLVDSGDNVLRI